MYCRNCGSKVDDNTSFCPNCGASLKEQKQNTQAQWNPYSAQNQNTGSYTPNSSNPNTSGTYNAGYNGSTYTPNGGNGGYGGGSTYTPNNQGYNPGNAQAAANPVKTRNLVLCIVLSLVTCGIYAIIWFYNLTEDVKTLSGNVSGTGGGLAILLSIVTCGIYTYVWMYKQGEALDGIKRSRGLEGEHSGLIFLLLSIFGLGIVSYALIQNEINNLAGEA